MAKFEKSVVINQSLEKTFEFVVNAENEPLWQTQVQEAKFTSDGPIGVGSTSAQTAHFMGRRIETTGEITEYEQNVHWAWKSTSGPIPGSGRTAFEAVGEGQTKVTISADLELGGFFKVAEPLVARSGGRLMESNLANLKDLLEAEADSGD